jgi:hypothetical protein
MNKMITYAMLFSVMGTHAFSRDENLCYAETDAKEGETVTIAGVIGGDPSDNLFWVQEEEEELLSCRVSVDSQGKSVPKSCKEGAKIRISGTIAIDEELGESFVSDPIIKCR